MAQSQTTHAQTRFPMPIPFGWFCVGYSDELQDGEVRAVRYFGQDLVLFRSDEGTVGLLDAYCPHMGAHLGKGGKVEGGALRCPFHAWAFDPNGYCTDIPYAKTMPPQCKRAPLTGAYPVVERNGVIWAWYHSESKEPWFDVIEVPEAAGMAGWAGPHRRLWTFASNPQEIAENGVDLAHFRYVHEMDAVPEGKTSYEGHIRRSNAHGTRENDMPDGTKEVIPTSVETVQNGAGQKFTRINGMVDLCLQVLATPVEEDKVELRFSITWPEAANDSPQMAATRMAIDNVCGMSGVEGDIPIWENKIHMARPFLCDSDGPILRFRKYFEQFYVGWKMPGTLAEAS